METQNPAPNSIYRNLSQNTCDTGNALIALFFGLTGFIYLSGGDWAGALVWLCLAASCALAIGISCRWQENWKRPRTLASLACCALAIALLLFAPPHREKSHAEASAKPATSAPTAK